MNLTDWIGFVGVSILLVGFVLNLLGKISMDSTAYTGLNMIGAAVTCLASVLLVYWPFIILESIWTIVSGVAFIKSFRKN